MRVRFAGDVLANRAAWPMLDRIVDTLADPDAPNDERHLWDIDDLDALLASEWLQPPSHYRSSLTREIASHSYKALATVTSGRTMHAWTITVTLAPGTEGHREWCLPPTDALDVLRAPLLLVVENSDSDGAFLRTMARVFGRRDFELAVDRGWCELVHAGGGGEALKRVDERLRQGARSWRVCVLSDGDRLSPAVVMDHKARALSDACAVRRVLCLVLHKREIENYLPVPVLALSHPAPLVSTFARLTQAQRDHFDMKEGFRNRPADDAEYRGLFSGLPETRRERLADGFGKRVGELFGARRTDFRRDEVERMCTTCPDELPAMLNILESLL